MSSLTRRMQRANGRRTTPPVYVAGPNAQFGSKMGVTNAKAKDLIARQRREKKQ